jgi:hypothetical protein
MQAKYEPYQYTKASLLGALQLWELHVAHSWCHGMLARQQPIVKGAQKLHLLHQMTMKTCAKDITFYC